MLTTALRYSLLPKGQAEPWMQLDAEQRRELLSHLFPFISLRVLCKARRCHRGVVSVDTVVCAEDTQLVTESSQSAFLNLADRLFTTDARPPSQPSAFPDISSAPAAEGPCGLAGFFRMGVCLKPFMLRLLVSAPIDGADVATRRSRALLCIFSMKQSLFKSREDLGMSTLSLLLLGRATCGQP